MRSCSGTALVRITFGWSILDSFFSHPISFHSFLLKTCRNELWMVRSWIPSFLLPISFQIFFAKTCKNELQMDRCGERGRAHHKHTQIPSILSFFLCIIGTRTCQSKDSGFTCLFCTNSWNSGQLPGFLWLYNYILDPFWLPTSLKRRACCAKLARWTQPWLLHQCAIEIVETLGILQADLVLKCWCMAMYGTLEILELTKPSKCPINLLSKKLSVQGMVLWDWLIKRATEKWCHPWCKLIWWSSVLLPMDSYGAEYHRVRFFPREGVQF